VRTKSQAQKNGVLRWAGYLAPAHLEGYVNATIFLIKKISFFRKIFKGSAPGISPYFLFKIAE